MTAIKDFSFGALNGVVAGLSPVAAVACGLPSNLLIVPAMMAPVVLCRGTKHDYFSLAGAFGMAVTALPTLLLVSHLMTEQPADLHESEQQPVHTAQEIAPT